MIFRVVGALNHDSFASLRKRQHSLSKEDAVSWNAVEEQIIELWSREYVLVVANTVNKNRTSASFCANLMDLF